MSDLQKNLTAAGASAESAEKIAGIIKAAAQAAALTPVELNRCLRIGADEARRIYYWEKKHAPLLPAGGGERLKEIKKLFTDRGLAADDERFKHILLEAPSLLFLPASTIEDNIKSLCRFPGLPAIDEETYRRAALKQPRLLCLRPQTIADNIRGLVNHPALCGREGKPLLKCREYIAAALKRPQLLYQLPETLAANVSGVVSHPALKDDDGKPLFTTETYLQTALKKPQLFLHAPETVVEHVTRFLRHPAFADENGNSLIKAGGTGSSLRTDGQTCLRRGRLPFTVLILSAASGREKKNNRPKKEKSPYCTKKLPPSFSDAEAFFITERISADKESFSGTGIKHLVADGDYRPVKQFYFTILLNAFFPVKKNQRAVFVAVPVINQHRRQIEIFRQTVRAFVNLFPRVAGGKQQNAAASHLQFPISALRTGFDAVAVAKQVTAAVRILRNACFSVRSRRERNVFARFKSVRFLIKGGNVPAAAFRTLAENVAGKDFFAKINIAQKHFPAVFQLLFSRPVIEPKPAVGQMIYKIGAEKLKLKNVARTANQRSRQIPTGKIKKVEHAVFFAHHGNRRVCKLPVVQTGRNFALCRSRRFFHQQTAAHFPVVILFFQSYIVSVNHKFCYF